MTRTTTMPKRFSSSRRQPHTPWTWLPLLLVSLALLNTALVTEAQGFRPEHKATLELAADKTSYAPGSSVGIAAQVVIEDHWHANSVTPTYDYLVPTELSIHLGDQVLDAEISYPPHSLQKFEFADEPIAVYDGTFRILARFDLPADATGDSVEVRGALRYQACDDRQCLPPITREANLTLSLGADGAPANEARFAPVADEGGSDTGGAHGAAAASPAGADGTSPGLLAILAFAFLGGLILNAMPCVLPVLSLKIFGLVKSAGQGRRHLLTGSLATTAGIVLSFWLLALAAVLASQTGAAVGWGIQFQQPAFVAFLAVVVVLFSLNMWGLFEIPLPQSLAQAAGGQQREGLAGHFVSGLFATLMATPCSAPFLGTAVGFALAQQASTIFLVFTAIGLGLASPYLMIGLVPRSVDFLPKPGAWMVTFRGVMGFFLAAAAVWLFYVLAGQITPESLALVQLTLLALALATWLQSRAQKQGWRRLGAMATVGAAVACIGVAATAAPVASSTEASSRIAWIPFDEQQAKDLSAEGKLVFVDFTADWCLTCKANERLVLETETVAGAFESHDVVPMKGDWTNRDDTIGEYLSRFGRSSVPFYILYRPGQEPYPFGELLTKQRVLDAIDDAIAAMPPSADRTTAANSTATGTTAVGGS